MKKWIVAVMGIAAFLAGGAISARESGVVPESNPPDASSPYFFVQGDPSVDRFPLLKTEAKVTVAGIIAEVELNQVYKNEGKKTIEAIYVFPLGTRSAIHAMKMKIGSRVIEAKIEEREQAAKIYEQAKHDGKTASLLTQERPNVFQMKVANILPGDQVEVTVRYNEILIPENGIYEYVFPAVVGPRYTGIPGTESHTGETWTATPQLHQGEKATYDFDIRVDLNAGMEISSISVPSHRAEVKRTAPNQAEIALAPGQEKEGNRDFILRYSLRGEAIHSGLLLYPGEADEIWLGRRVTFPSGEDEKYFLLIMEPPARVIPEMIPPREYLFIVDVSGSMNGFPLEVSKTLIKKILNGLRPGDHFNILFFAGGADVLASEPLPATAENLRRALKMLDSRQGSGGTEILPALRQALALPKKEGLSRTVIIATDGYVSVEKGTFDLIREKLGESNFFAFGIGSAVNRYLIEGIARAGRGEPFVATSEKEAKDLAEKFFEYVQAPLLTDIKVDFQGFDSYEVEPSSLPDLFAQRPLKLLGKYRTAAGEIRITGRTAIGDFEKVIKVTPSAEDRGNQALRYIWARERIANLSDYSTVGEDVRKAVTELGLKYHLMTAYTSFVAVDTVVRETGEVVTVKQPLPLPEGVSDLAVGGGGGILACKSLAPMAGQALYTSCREEAAADRVAIQSPPRICLSQASLPAGVSLTEVEKLIDSSIRSDLEKAAQDWGLQSLTVVLKVEKGRVTEVTVKHFQGKECREETVKRIFQKLSFPEAVSGTVELQLAYI